MFEINYSQLIQYEILEKLVTFIAVELANASSFKKDIITSSQDLIIKSVNDVMKNEQQQQKLLVKCKFL